MYDHAASHGDYAMKWAAAAVLAVFPLSSLSARSAFIDGNQLHQWALASKRVSESRSLGDQQAIVNDGLDSARYRAYIEGVVDSYSGEFVCIPPETKLGQIAAIVSNFLEQHPELWAKNADALVAGALKGPFPCTKAK